MTRVIFVMLDGLRPDAITPERTPHLTRAIARGAHTLTARSVVPSITLPCHLSLMMSVPPARHGILSNQYVPIARPVQGLFDLAHDAEKTCAMIYNWEELRDLSAPGALAYSHMIRASYDMDDGDDRIVAHAAPIVAAGVYDFTFIYLGTIDIAGHWHGWMSDGYLAQVQKIDALVGTLIDAVTDDAVMILQADHGGHDRFHGTEEPEDMTIPWIMLGAGVRAGHTIARDVNLLDTAPTIAHLLGLSAPREWEGTPVVEALIG
ncbi:MAG: alkaline phosphatase family protein [Chloroflexota bacterium]|nr:alkaline phosphatase family protein [Chloroflexota bacterium]